MASLDPESMSSALDELRSMMNPDGYDVIVDPEPLTVRIVATPEACPECLVPASVMRPIISGMLAKQGLTGDWALEFPTDSH